MSARSLVAAGAHRVLGVAFLALLLFGVWATYAVFTKKFVDYVPVTLETSKIGLQLPALADVKVRGVIVGEVREISTDGDGARLELAIKPEKTDVIPANATARIEPKTVFGEKYVEIQIPDAPASEPISAGDVITESEVAIEVEELLNDLYPFLRTVQPAELNYTLTAFAMRRSREAMTGETPNVLPWQPLRSRAGWYERDCARRCQGEHLDQPQARLRRELRRLSPAEPRRLRTAASDRRAVPGLQAAVRELHCQVRRREPRPALPRQGRLRGRARMIKALIFDCDGVLVDTERDGHRVALFGDLGADVEREGALPHGGTACDHDQVGRLETGKLLVEVDEAGGEAGDLASHLLEPLDVLQDVLEQGTDLQQGLGRSLLGHTENGARFLLRILEDRHQMGILRPVFPALESFVAAA